MKKALSLMLAALMVGSMLTACGAPKEEPAPAAEPSAAAEEPAPAAEEPAPAEEPAAEPSAAAEAPAADAGAKPYIAVISKGFQHQFWQTVMKGSEDAAAKYGVEMTFQGPPSESDINDQVEMLNSALSKNPAAICLAALDTESVSSQLTDAKSKNIPVVGFDSGVPNAPEGAIAATAATDNEAAGALGAQSMFDNAVFAEKLKAATPENPVTIGCASQDATSASIVGRTVGFLNKMKELCEGLYPGAVEVVGHDNYKVAATAPVAVSIQVAIPPTSSTTDCQVACQGLLNAKNLIGLFCSNAGTVDGLLAATTDGSDLDREAGKFKDLTVVGFDAGATQKAAVKNGWFIGAITQDPYMIGYLAVELAYKAINGETVADADTGCKFYTAANMDEPDIAQLLYD